MRAHDTVVIGGGQSGLAMSYHLSRLGRDHVILERARIAERWRSERWDSLRFQLPNWSIGLPGLAYDGVEPDAFSHNRDIVAFLERYAGHIAAPVRTSVSVIRMRQTGAGFHLETTDGAIMAHNVVVATGPFHRPLIPDTAARLAARIAQLPAAAYRNPDALPAGAVLVVGSGASGCQIADELLAAGRKVFLSVSPHRRAPRRYRDRDFFWWLSTLGRLEVTIDSFPARRPPKTTVITGIDGGYDVDVRRFVADGGVALGRFRGADGERLFFDDDAEAILADADSSCSDFVEAAESYVSMTSPELPAPCPASTLRRQGTIVPLPELDAAADDIGAVIWATGYGYDYGWLEIDILDPSGAPRQERGITACPGLYFLGLNWMHTVTSGLLCGVGADAEFVSRHLATRLER